jgi:DnaJ-class molecular chaperone
MTPAPSFDLQSSDNSARSTLLGTSASKSNANASRRRSNVAKTQEKLKGEVEPDPTPAEDDPEAEPDEDEQEDAPAAVVELFDGHRLDVGDVPAGHKFCPLCGGGAIVPDVVNQDPERETCDVCGGLGMLATGSLLADSAMATCSHCAGAGYKWKEGRAPDNLPPLGNGDQAPVRTGLGYEPVAPVVP